MNSWTHDQHIPKMMIIISVQTGKMHANCARKSLWESLCFPCRFQPSSFIIHTCVTSNIWWRHQIAIFSTLLVLCAGNSPVNSPHKGQWGGALVFSLTCPWTNGYVNNRDAGDLRCYRAHYEVTVMNKITIATTASVKCQSLLQNCLKLNFQTFHFEIWI